MDRTARQLTNGRILSRILNVFFPPRAMQLAQVGLVLVIGSDRSSLDRAQMLPRGAHKRQTTMEVVHVELISTKLWSALSPKRLAEYFGTGSGKNGGSWSHCRSWLLSSDGFVVRHRRQIAKCVDNPAWSPDLASRPGATRQSLMTSCSFARRVRIKPHNSSSHLSGIRFGQSLAPGPKSNSSKLHFRP